MFRFLNAPGNRTPIGCFDWILLYVAIAGLLGVLLGFNPTRNAALNLFAGVFWFCVAGGIFLWRRGWIRHWRQQQRLKEEQEKLTAKRLKAEQAHSSSASSTSTVGTGTDSVATANAPTTSTATANTTTATSKAIARAEQVAASQPPTVQGEIVSVVNCLRIQVPVDTKWSPTQALGFLRAIIERHGESFPQLSIVATKGRIQWEVTSFADMNESERQSFENLVQTFYPGGVVELQPQFTFDTNLYRQYHIYQAEYQLDFQNAKSVHSIKRDDPLTSVVQAIGNLRDSEEMRYTINLTAPVRLEEKHIIDLLTVSAREAYRPVFGGVDTRSADHAFGSILGGTVSWISQEINLRNQRLDRFTPSETKQFLAKLSQPLIGTYISLSFDTPTKSRLSALQDAISSVYGLSSGEEISISKGYTSPVIEITSGDAWLDRQPMGYLMALAPENEGDVDGTQAFGFTLTSEEVASLWHLPHKDMTVSEIAWAAPPPPSELMTSLMHDRIVIGKVGETPISLMASDLRHHAFVSGQTGTGKSNFLHNFTHQLIKSNQGFALLDPHGTVINGLMRSSLIAERRDKVLLLDLNNLEYPIPLNPFRVPEGVSPKFAFNIALWILKTIYKDSWSESQMETVMRRTLELVLTDPDATPLDMQRVLNNDNYRRKRFAEALQQGMSTSAEMWWQDEFGEMTPHARREKSRSTLNRLRTFLDGGVELMTCHPDGLDFRKLIDEGYILLVSLYGDEVKSEVGSLGAILFAQLFLNSMSLGEYDSTLPPRFYMVIDETHMFINSALQDMLSEARKFGLSLIMADQWLGQLDTDTRKAIVNNKGTTISFAASEDEAPTMARLYEPHVTVDDLINQDVGQAAVRSRHEGKVLPAFRVQTLPPLPGENFQSPESTWDDIWQQTIDTLKLKPASQVRQWIRERYRSKATDAVQDEATDTAEEPRTDVEIIDSTDTTHSGDEEG